MGLPFSESDFSTTLASSAPGRLPFSEQDFAPSTPAKKLLPFSEADFAPTVKTPTVDPSAKLVYKEPPPDTGPKADAMTARQGETAPESDIDQARRAGEFLASLKNVIPEKAPVEERKPVNLAEVARRNDPAFQYRTGEEQMTRLDEIRGGGADRQLLGQIAQAGAEERGAIANTFEVGLGSIRSTANTLAKGVAAATGTPRTYSDALDATAAASAGQLPAPVATGAGLVGGVLDPAFIATQGALNSVGANIAKGVKPVAAPYVNAAGQGAIGNAAVGALQGVADPKPGLNRLESAAAGAIEEAPKGALFGTAIHAGTQGVKGLAGGLMSKTGAKIPPAKGLDELKEITNVREDAPEVPPARDAAPIRQEESGKDLPVAQEEAPSVGREGAASDEQVVPRATQELVNETQAQPRPTPLEGQEPQAPAEKSGGIEKAVMSEDQFLASRGASSLGFGESALHRQPGSTPKERNQRAKAQAAKDAELAQRREVLRTEFQQKKDAGAVREPTRVERLIDTANGHEDNPSVQAARRILEKQGVEWNRPRIPGRERQGGFMDVTAVDKAADEVIGLTKRFYRTVTEVPGSVYRAAKVNIPRGVNAMRNMGEAGKQLATQTEQVARKGQARGEVDTRDMEGVLKGLTARDAELVAKIGQNRVEPKSGKTYRELYPKLATKADAALPIADRSMNEAASLGFVRKQTGDLKGSGAWYPQTPNREGLSMLEAASKRGLADSRVATLADKLVQQGYAKTPDDALAKLLDYRQSQLRGINGYLESTRILLPEEYVDFNPRRTLPALLHKNANLVEAARIWGKDFEGAKAQIARVGQETSPHNAEVLSDWLRAHFDANPQGPGDRAIGAASNYLTASKIGFSLMSAIQNMGQRFTNTTMYEPQVTLKTLKQFPPLVNRWFKSARAIEDRMGRSGVTSPTTELSSVETTAPGHALTQLSMKPFSSVEKGNQTHAALMAEIGIQRDLDKLANSKEGGRLKSVLESVVSATGLRDPDAAASRRLQRITNLSDEQLMQRVKSGERLSPDEVKDAIWRFNNQTQFALNLATERLWWRSHPFVRLMAKFKPWGVDQLAFIANHVGKEAAKGNLGPLTRFSVAMVAVGEVYNTIKDALTGSDKAVSTYLRSDKDKNAGEIGTRILGNFVRGGGIGMVADMTYGLGSYLAGPAGSTLTNAGRAIADVTDNPSLRGLGMAARRFVENDVSAVRQVQSAVDRIDQKFVNPHNKTFAASRWRQRAYEQKKQKERPEFADKALGAVKDFAVGSREQHGTTERTLPYHYASKQIDVGDVSDAVDYLRPIIQQAKPGAERKKILEGIEASMRMHAPLGAVAEKDREAWLKQFSAEEKAEALKVQNEWISNYRKAIRAAQAQ